MMVFNGKCLQLNVTSCGFALAFTVKVNEYNIRNDAAGWQMLISINVPLLVLR